MSNSLNRLVISPMIERALAEDIGMGDITTDSIFSEETGTAVLVAKAEGIIGGLPVLKETYRLICGSIEVVPLITEGTAVAKGQKIATVSGLIRHILSGERVALNFLQRISGIATLTARYVAITDGTKTTIIDTRKTLPGLRVFDKYAVRLGGGHNHRFGLYDCVLIKDNHISGAGSITNAVKLVKSNIPVTSKIEVEVKNLAEVKECLENVVDLIMFDNMPFEEMKTAITLINGKVPVEISGGVNLSTLPELCKLGADYISVGALTHSASAFDISMLL